MSGRNKKPKSVAEIRRDYNKEVLVTAEVCDNPIDQFTKWFDQALSTDMLDPNAMTLSTATKDGIPSSRIVLLKGVDEKGFQFYTNYKSQKGKELAENPRAALCFYWATLERQVRIQGKVRRINRKESKNYFQQRPRLSQLSAWASEQSSKVDSRDELLSRFKEIEKRFENKEIPLPEFWGGYLLQPNRIEFWQGREGRMHDRICYKKKEDSWTKFRLAP
jgi:pyridoxamine 5'-phosphate oxidase